MFKSGVKRVLLLMIAGLLIWHGIRSIQGWTREREWNKEKQELLDKYLTEIAEKDTVIQRWMDKSKKQQAELRGWYRVTGAYDPMEFTGIARDTIIITDEDTVRQVSFSIDTGSIDIYGWTRTPPPTYQVGFHIDPLTLKIGIVRKDEKLQTDYIWVNDPLFRIENVEIEQLWRDEEIKRDWFGWLLGCQVFGFRDYEIGVLGGVKLGRTSILGGVDSRDYMSVSVMREF